MYSNFDTPLGPPDSLLLCKLIFIEQCTVDTVGAGIARPRIIMLRIRRNPMRIRKILPHGRRIAAPTFTIETER